MAETVDRFQQGLQELFERGAREGRRDGRREGHRVGHREGRETVLRRQVTRRFGEKTAERVFEVLDGLPGIDVIDRVTDALFECGTGEEFVSGCGRADDSSRFGIHRGRPPLNLGRPKTMAELSDSFQQALDELVERGAREGRCDGLREGLRDGRREGQKTVLRRQVARRFGEDTAGRVSEVIEGLPGPDAIDRVIDALFECGTGEEFVERLRTA